MRHPPLNLTEVEYIQPIFDLSQLVNEFDNFLLHILVYLLDLLQQDDARCSSTGNLLSNRLQLHNYGAFIVSVRPRTNTIVLVAKESWDRAAWRCAEHLGLSLVGADGHRDALHAKQ